MTAGTAGPELRRLFEAAIAAGRRVRAGTALGRGVASVSQVGIELVRQRLGTLEGVTVLLIGAGTVSELAAKQLAGRGIRELLVVGRDAARAQGLADRHGGRALPSHQLDEGLAQADVVVSSTGAPQPIVERARVECALTHRPRGARPMLLIDLAVPRDIATNVAGLPGVEVYAIDDLEQVVAQTVARRTAELPAAYAILRSEVARFTRWLGSRQAFAELSLPSPAAARTT
jgi:glutamyl-tRNA reductase